MMTSSPYTAIALAAFAVWSPLAWGAPASPEPGTPTEFFEARIRPILVKHCYTCHSADTKPAGGLRVDDRNGLLAGGDTGPAVVPGDPSASLLLRRVAQENPNRRMPKEGERLTAEQIADLTRWIQDGAAWPAVKVPTSLGQPKEWYESVRRQHWAWQPLNKPEPPEVRDSAWPKDELDRFVLAGLEEAGLAPVRDADRRTLLRRVTFDLTGLPPSPAELDAFLADESPDALTKAVDRLLASPEYGVHWGRHWLDVARYGESTGPSRNIPYPYAWKYRDYVVDALNADIPFDRFVTEQIAGDLLPADGPEERNRLLTATGFLALGVKDVNQRFKVRFVMDNVDDQIDAVSRSLLGLTVSCARCHDHKFDPIPTTDYYALAGIFTSTDNAAGVRNKMGGGGLDYYDPSMLITLAGDLPPPPEAEIQALEARVATAKKAWDDIRGTPEGLAKGPNGAPKQRKFRLEYERLRNELLSLTDPAARGHAVHGVRDATQVGDTEVRVRGEAERLGPTVPRGFLKVFDVPGAVPVNPAQSGRKELAAWITSAQNPLTSRVIVNRVWYHLFGRGIVSTPDNFGTTGDTPSNPALLDHLADRFVHEGWSIKRLVRAVVLSRTYQLSSDATPAHLAKDPTNQLLWRHTPRRLTTEEIRDAMLFAAGSLATDRPVGSPTQELQMVELRDNGAEARTIHQQADASKHRSLYLPLLRGIAPRSLEAFDPVEQTLVTGCRETTTVPSQALYLLNSSFVRRQALTLSERILAEATKADGEQVKLAFRLTLGREPNADELARSRVFLSELESARPESVAATPQASDIAFADSAESQATPKPQPANPDEADQTGVPVIEDVVRPKDARTAAWLAFTQVLLGSAEFLYVP